MTVARRTRALAAGRLALAALAALAACADAPTEPLERNTPVREWTYGVFTDDTTAFRVVRADSQTGGQVNDEHLFGSLILAPDGEDARATGEVFSSPDGSTYWVSTEEGPERGTNVSLIQRQSFRKNAADATLELHLTAIVLQGLNQNFDPPCPDGVGFCPVHMQATAGLSVRAYDETRQYNHKYSTVSLTRGRDGWQRRTASPNGVIFSDGDFFIDSPSSARATVRLARSIPIPIDISRVAEGAEFTLAIFASAGTYNLEGRESYLSAYLRDPLSVGGSTVSFRGLTPTNRPLPLPPEGSAFGAAPECTAPQPGAGAIALAVPTFSVAESPFAGTDGVVVTRTGGTSGPVSATLRTSDGSAAAGRDYRSVTTTVAFADGDAGPRTIPVPVLPNTRVDGDRTVNLALSDPRGCATLGAATGVLTIHDDDAPSAPSGVTIGGTVAGLAGSGLVLRNVVGGEELAVSGGAFTFARRTARGIDYDVVVATQPSAPAQLCTVANGRGTAADAAVTNVAVTCTTPAPVAGLDPGFGTGGKVATPVASGEGEAVVVQPDGRIVVAGKSTVSPAPGAAGSADFTLLRYQPDGTVDATFGTAGLATAGFAAGRTDEAFDAALQPDGRIVVAGRTQTASGDFDVGLARFTADGRLDPTFGAGGTVVTDFGPGSAYAQAVLVQPDGRIVVAGHTTVGFGNDFALARYNSDGTPDGGFGTNGRVTTNVAGRADLAFALALAPDGKIVLAGRAEQADSRRDDFGLVRYNADGTLDVSFGAGGIVTTDFTGGGSQQANDVAVLPDGRIVAVGYSGGSTGTFDFALARYTSDGRLDASFGSAGLVTTELSGQDDFAEGLAVQGDGRLVVIGRRTSATFSDLALVRYLPSGAPDTGFGSAGALAVDFFGAADLGQGVAVQPDGRIVGAGHARNGTAQHVVVVRVVP